MPDTWNGPCVCCGDPTTVPFLEEFVCNGCKELMDEIEEPNYIERHTHKKKAKGR